MGLFGKDESSAVHIEGRELECRICGERRFHHKRAQLNTALLSFFDLDWANATADTYICDRCGYVHWFLHP